MKSQNVPIWTKAIVAPTVNIRDVAMNLSKSALRLALVVDSTGKLLGTISDGDIRRGLLRGLTFESPIVEIHEAPDALSPHLPGGFPHHDREEPH